MRTVKDLFFKRCERNFFLFNWKGPTLTRWLGMRRLQVERCRTRNIKVPSLADLLEGLNGMVGLPEK